MKTVRISKNYYLKFFKIEKHKIKRKKKQSWSNEKKIFIKKFWVKLITKKLKLIHIH